MPYCTRRAPTPRNNEKDSDESTGIQLNAEGKDLFEQCLVSFYSANPCWPCPQIGMPSLESCECSFNPLDSSIVCLVGDGVSRMLRLQDGQLRVIQNYLYKRQGQRFTSHAWLSEDSLIVASYSGMFLRPCIGIHMFVSAFFRACFLGYSASQRLLMLLFFRCCCFCQVRMLLIHGMMKVAEKS